MPQSTSKYMLVRYQIYCTWSVQGKYADAEVLYKRAVKIWTHICGPDHPRVATALNNRAAVLKAQVTESKILV